LKIDSAFGLAHAGSLRDRSTPVVERSRNHNHKYQIVGGAGGAGGGGGGGGAGGGGGGNIVSDVGAVSDLFGVIGRAGSVRWENTLSVSKPRPITNAMIRNFLIMIFS
jgi:hypothetical protein